MHSFIKLVRNQLSTLKLQDAVHFLGQRDIVRRDQGADPAIVDLFKKNFKNLLRGFGIKVSCRLVREQELGLIDQCPRYRDALGQTDDPAAYFGALQRAGYATDPAYADKIGRILEGEPMQRFRRQAGGGARDT